jgi:microcystin-dependent protein
MGTPFLSQIQAFSFGFAPRGWSLCNGQLLPINQNQALFSLLGTTYGGDGRTTFGLPNLQGRVPIHMGGGHTLGENAGVTSVTVSIAELPAHVHTWGATSVVANSPDPTSNLLGGVAEYNGSASNLVAMYPGQLSNTGGSQAHLNQQPFLTLNFCIALQGIFPSQN